CWSAGLCESCRRFLSDQTRRRDPRTLKARAIHITTPLTSKPDRESVLLWPCPLSWPLPPRTSANDFGLVLPLWSAARACENNPWPHSLKDKRPDPHR